MVITFRKIRTDLDQSNSPSPSPSCSISGTFVEGNDIIVVLTIPILDTSKLSSRRNSGPTRITVPHSEDDGSDSSRMHAEGPTKTISRAIHLVGSTSVQKYNVNDV